MNAFITKLTTDWQLAACVIAVVIWLAQKFGATAAAKLKAFLATLKPQIESKTTILSAWPLIVCALLLGPRLLPSPSPVVPVVPDRVPDLYDQCAAAGRILLCDELEKIASQTFKDVQDKEDAINNKILDVVDASFEPFNKSLAEAAKQNRLVDFAAKVRKGELRD